MSSDFQFNKFDQNERVWIVSELYYPEETSTGYYLTRIAEGLATEVETKAICGQPNYFKRGTKAPTYEIHNNVEIFRASGTTFDKNIILFRLINMLTLSISVLFLGLKKFKEHDKVLVVTTPPLLPFVIALASLIKGTSYTLLIHDNYPEILVAVGKTKKDSLITNIADFANRWLYKYASKIVVVGRDMKELLLRKTSGLDIPIVYIPNWAELESVTPDIREKNALLLDHKLNEKFVFLYAGNMGHPNDIESIIEAAKELKNTPQIHFIFLGTGVKRKWLDIMVSQNTLSNVTLLDPKPRSEQQVFLNACDVALVSLIAKMNGVSMPSRTYNILAAGKPILGIVEEGSELDRVVKEDDCGLIVKPDDVDSLVEAIIQFTNLDKDILKLMGTNARRAAITKYSLESAVKAYREVLIGN